MKTILWVFLVFIVPFWAQSQEFVKIDLTAFYDKIPAPPTDVTTAQQRLICVEENTYLNCSADKFYQPLVDSLRVIKQKWDNMNTALNLPDATAMQNINPEEIQKKMAAMTPAEQVEFAMKLNQQMGFGARALMPETDAVTEAIEAYSELSMKISMQLNDQSAAFKEGLRLAHERERKHQEVNAWHKAEYDKLPQVSYGEAGRGPELKAEYALKMVTVEKHIAVENEYLQAVQKLWPTYRGQLKAQYSPFQQKLAAINYGEVVQNIENKRILIGGQGMLFGPADELLAFSQEATENVIQWLLQKHELAKQKPVE